MSLDGRPYRLVFGRIHSLDKLRCSRDETPATNAQLELVIYVEKYFRVVGRALDGSVKTLSTSTKFIKRRANPVTCDLLRFIEDDRYFMTSFGRAVSSPEVNMMYADLVPKLLSFVRVNAGGGGAENFRRSKLRVEARIECLIEYEYDEGLTITLAVRSSEEEQRRRKLRMAIETMLIGEREWGSDEGTCRVCLERFECGEKLDQMPCCLCCLLPSFI